jgi:DNA-binding MarR family transcriptional regulator
MNKNDKINAIIHNVPEKEEPYKKITEKQWTVYYYLLSISNYNSKDREDHRFVYKRDINITAISKTLGISRSTFYTATDALEKKNLITKYDNYYTMKVPYSYTQISRNLL